jgi:hypothetical protein
MKFLDLLGSLMLNPEMLPMFRETVRSVWRDKAAQQERNLSAARRRISELQERRDQIVTKWIANQITKEIYDDQMSKVGAQFEAAGLAEGQAVIGLAEVELLLDFAGWMLNNADMVWSAASYKNQIKIQWALLPNGLTVSPEGFGTPEGPLFLLDLQQEQAEEYCLASPRGFEPLLSP